MNLHSYHEDRAYKCLQEAGTHLYRLTTWYCGDRGSTVVKILRYKSEGRCFDPRWCPDRTMALRSTQPLTEMSTRCISWW
jgi:hypothetical protein